MWYTKCTRYFSPNSTLNSGCNYLLLFSNTLRPVNDSHTYSLIIFSLDYNYRAITATPLRTISDEFFCLWRLPFCQSIRLFVWKTCLNDNAIRLCWSGKITQTLSTNQPPTEVLIPWRGNLKFEPFEYYLRYVKMDSEIHLSPWERRLPSSCLIK